MNEAHEVVLQQLGFTRNESRVYLALLKLGSATAVEITKLSHVHRVNVYDALERLRGKGLISTIFQGKKRVYEAADPQQLLKFVQEKEMLVKQVLPELDSEFRAEKERQQVHHFFGAEGVLQAYHMMLEQNDLIYGIGGSGLNRKYLKHRHELFNAERIKRGIQLKVLYYEFTRKKRERSWQNDATCSVRYLPDKFRTIGMVDICGNLVVNLIPVEDNIMAIVIENKTLADTYRQLFHFMWQHAKI